MASYTIRFEARKDKINKQGESPISLILSVSGQRKRIPTGSTIPFVNWSQSNQKAIFLTKKQAKELGISFPMLENDINDLNAKLESIEQDIKTIVRKFELDNLQYDVEMLYSEYCNKKTNTTKKAEPSNFLFDFMDNYITVNEPTRAKNSMSVYKSLKNHLKGYQDQKKKKVKFENINYDFFLSFQAYLTELEIKHETTGRIQTLNNITIAKQLSTLKTFLGYARKSGIKTNDSYKDFTIKRQKLEVIALTEEEYKAVKDLDLSGNKRLDKARDIFVFMCATSLRYSDYSQLRREHIKGGEIKLTIKKTRKTWDIPLNADSFAILEKYKGLNSPLPKISNQKLSKYIREVCKLAEINDQIEIVRYKGAEAIRNFQPKHELVSAHTGRKTFCTLSLERGIPAEIVMKLSGHESYESFKRYINISKQFKVTEMKKAWGEAPIMKVAN